MMFAGGLALILMTSFFAIYRLPGDPARMILGPRASAQSVEDFRQSAGLNDPVARQFWHFVGKVATLNLGESLAYRRPVVALLRERMGQTLQLIGCALLMLLFFAVLLPIGLRAAGLDSADNGIRALWTAFSAAPPYVLALLTLTVFAGFLRVLPAVFERDSIACWAAASFVLAAYPTALASRLFHDALASAIFSEYATRARAQGFSEAAILIREALVNALPAPVSAIANGLAYFFTGTFFVEVAFGVGGVGSLTYEAIQNKDMTVLAGVCLLFAVVISALSAALDLAQHLLNPRLRRSHEWQG
jgi:ABC-type dipeptide/oligopeptide/nickel transport system permease component